MNSILWTVSLYTCHLNFWCYALMLQIVHRTKIVQSSSIFYDVFKFLLHFEKCIFKHYGASLLHLSPARCVLLSPAPNTNRGVAILTSIWIVFTVFLKGSYFNKERGPSPNIVKHSIISILKLCNHSLLSPSPVSPSYGLGWAGLGWS